MAHCIDLKRWYLITPSRARREAEDFVKALQRAGNGMRFQIANPRMYVNFSNFFQPFLIIIINFICLKKKNLNKIVNDTYFNTFNLKCSQ